MLELSKATFLYAPQRGIQSATLKVEQGEVVGIVGGNGVGKSTLLGLISAALIPQSGSVTLTIEGSRGKKRTYSSDTGIGYRLHIGYLSERAPVCLEMSLQGYLRYRARLRGERFLRIRRRVNEAMEICGLSPLRKVRLESLSTGALRRVAIAEAIVTQPAVLILDDPFAGVDLAFRDTFAEMIHTLAKHSHILIGGHDPELMAACCSRFVCVNDAHIINDNLTYEQACTQIREFTKTAPKGQKV